MTFHIPPSFASVKPSSWSSISAACALIWGITAPSVASADAWVLQPSARLEGIYDDNFRLETEEEEPDQVNTARISGALRLARVTETTDIAGLLRVDGNFYSGDDERLDDQSNQLLDLSYFKLGELSRWGGAISYRRDTLLRTIRGTEDPDDVTVEPDDDVDEGLVEQDVERQRLVFGPSWSRFLTERIEVGLSYRYSDVSFSNTAGLGADIPGSIRDFDMHQLGAEWLTQVTERDRLAVVFEGDRYEAADDQRYDNFDLQAGVVHDFSETATGLLTVGGRYTDFEGPRVNGSDTGFVATLSGTKRTGLTTFTGTLERTVSPSASGNQVENDQLTFNVSRQLSERMEVRIRSQLFETESLQETASNANRRFVAVQPVLRFDLSPSWALETGYEYRRQKRFDEAESGDSNAVFLSLVYERPTVVEPEAPEL